MAECFFLRPKAAIGLVLLLDKDLRITAFSEKLQEKLVHSELNPRGPADQLALQEAHADQFISRFSEQLRGQCPDYLAPVSGAKSDTLWFENLEVRIPDVLNGGHA